MVLGGSEDDKVALVASFSKEVTDRGISAAEVIREAAQIVGGGGGGGGALISSMIVAVSGFLITYT